MIVTNIQVALGSKKQAYIPAEKLGSSEYCGLCHTKIYQQWNASAHHFSSFNNPIYRKVIISEIGTDDQETLGFCAACHDPLLVAADELQSFDVSSWQANSGITCLSCHRITEIGKQNGNYVIEEPFLHPFALAESPALQEAHKMLLQLTPWLHKVVLSKPMYQESKFCAVCHTLEVPSSINGHKRLSLFNEYQSWKKSHYNTENNNHNVSRRNCQDCHMPLVAADDPAAINGMIHDHSFAAGNTALPVFNRDFDHLKKVETFLKNDRLKIQLLGIRTEQQEHFNSPKKLTISENSKIQLKLALFNKGVGHHFPGGTADSNEAWLNLRCTDAQGKVLIEKGVLDGEGRLSEDAIRFGSDYEDIHGNLTTRATTTTRAVAIRNNRRIAPGESTEILLDFSLPADFTPPLQVTIKLNWRKYDPKFIQWVFDGRTFPKQPVTTLSKLEFSLPGV